MGIKHAFNNPKADGPDATVTRPSDWNADHVGGPDFSIGALLEGAPPANGWRMLWRAPYACTVTTIRSHFDAGTSVTVNARKNQASDFLAADVVNSTPNVWGAATADQNQSVAAGDDIEVELVATSGAVTKANIQLDFTRP